jgi:quercetin dioxygenase-like cupin family protein
MALPHAQPGQPIDIAPLGPALQRSASHAILKTRALELMRLVLRRGESVPPHRVYGELTLLCLEGSVAVDAGGHSCELRNHQMVLLPARQDYALRALEDSSLLMTVQLPPGMPGSASSTSAEGVPR